MSRCRCRRSLRNYALAAALFLVAIATAGAPTDVLPDGAVLVDEPSLARALSARDAITLAGQALAAARRGDAVLLGRLLADDDASTAIARESALARMLDALLLAPPDPRLAPLIATLATTTPRVYRRHPETRGDWFMPVFALDQRARGVLRLWGEIDGAEQLARLQRDGGLAAVIAGWPRLGPGVLRRYAETLDLPLLRELVARGEAAGHVVPGLAALLARRSAQFADLERALAVERGDVRIALLVEAPRWLSDDERLALAQRYAADPALGSAAVLSVAPLAARPGPARTALMAWLADPATAASAAAALARLPANELAATLETALAGRAGATAAQHARLALALGAARRESVDAAHPR